MTMHVLYDWEGPRTPIDAAPETAPAIGSIGSLVERLRAAQESLRRVPLDDLLGLCDAAATAWARADHPLCETIRRLGLGFLLLWMRRPHLASVCNRSLRGHPEALDRFVHLGETDAMLVRAQPRGLAVHWTAGNVPVLAFLSFLQSAICKNANLVKVSRESAGLLPRLLQGLADVEYTNDRGETITGRLLAGAVAVVYADRDDAEAARELSLAADVRVAWGGLDAVEAIMNLPRRFGTEDIVFGPKLSLAIVGAERLADAETAQRVARAVAADACAFDQRGCNSPHTVFVERGGGLSPREFARLLADAMEIESRRSPLQTVDPAATMNVLGVRAEYAMRATAYHDRELSWTVVYGEDDAGLAEPCFLRTLFVRPVGDVFDVVPLCGRRTQTVGLAVDDRRHRLADALTARDVERCPAVGAMRLYETPWDGLFPMDRLVRWVSTY